MIFIVPSTDSGKALGSLKDLVINTLPFGIAALASILERDGRPATIINDSITPLTPAMITALATAAPGRPVFGITSLTLQTPRAKELARLIKQVLPHAAVIVGGIHATALPEEFIDAGGIDYVFYGEADGVITELADKLSAGQDVSMLPGLIWRAPDGSIRKNPPAKLIDLKELPPFPYHLFEGQLDRYDLGAVISSRGCPYRCIFCSQRAITGTHHRTRPLDHVLREIDILVEQHHLDYITFFDDNFVVNRQWTYDLCNALIARGYDKKVRFMCQLRGDAVSEEALTILKKTGFDTLSFGIETGSERMAQVIQKGETVARNVQAVLQAHAFGFRTAGTFIIGFPTETAEDRKQTIDLAMSLPLDIVRINIGIPYPGTPFYDMVKSSLIVSEGWGNFNVVSPLVTGPFAKMPLPYVPPGASDDELRYLMLWNNMKFWLRPKGLASFFFKKSTFVTRLPPRWYLHFSIIRGIVATGLTVTANLLWIAYVAIKIPLAKRLSRRSGTDGTPGRG